MRQRTMLSTSGRTEAPPRRKEEELGGGLRVMERVGSGFEDLAVVVEAGGACVETTGPDIEAWITDS